MLRHAEAVARPGAAEGEQRQAARVFAAFDGVHARGAGHALVDELVDAPGGRVALMPSGSAMRVWIAAFGGGQVERACGRPGRRPGRDSRAAGRRR